MVQAILAGRKTQTRRVVKPNPDTESTVGVGTFNPTMTDRNGDIYPGPDTFGLISDDGEWCIKCPYGQPGDVLWVRETSFYDVDNDEHRYAADMCKSDIDFFKGFWKPSIHMPKEAARIWLEITNVRVERLQYISEEDAKAEGIEPCHTHGWRNYTSNIEMDCFLGNHGKTSSFRSLWHSINGEQSWNNNPWVWAVEFKQINKPK